MYHSCGNFGLYCSRIINLLFPWYIVIFLRDNLTFKNITLQNSYMFRACTCSNASWYPSVHPDSSTQFLINLKTSLLINLYLWPWLWPWPRRWLSLHSLEMSPIWPPLTYTKLALKVNSLKGSPLHRLPVVFCKYYECKCVLIQV